MSKRLCTIAMTAALMCVAGAWTHAQDAPTPKPVTPLKVDVVLSRYQGEKRISSSPYLLMINPGIANDRTSLRVGMDVVTGGQTSTTSAQGVTTTTRPDTRWIGTQIDCTVGVLPGDGGRYRLWLQVQDSSLYTPDEKTQGLTAFRSFSVANTLLIREGQTLQFSVGTDKITGETVRAEVTVAPFK